MNREFVYRSDQFALGGRWSGSENRHDQPFVAIIPESRYIQPPSRGFDDAWLDKIISAARNGSNGHKPEPPRPKRGCIAKAMSRLPRKQKWHELQRKKRDGARAWIEQAIAAMEAYLRGETIQMKNSWGAEWDWKDFDLADEISRGMIAWRVKPSIDKLKI